MVGHGHFFFTFMINFLTAGAQDRWGILLFGTWKRAKELGVSKNHLSNYYCLDKFHHDLWPNPLMVLGLGGSTHITRVSRNIC